MYTDVTLQMYFLIAVISFIGSVLFIYWMVLWEWYRSIPFVYVTVFLVGECIRSTICIWGRHILLCYPDEFLEFTLGWLWSSRLLLSLISVSAIVIHMSYRAATRKKWERRL